MQVHSEDGNAGVLKWLSQCQSGVKGAEWVE